MADEPRIVAELGRPATPEDIRDRREASRSFRLANNTTTNLLIAIGATLLVMVFLIVVVVRPDQASPRPAIDWAAEAAAVQASAPALVLSPTLPDGWTANRAAFLEVDDTETWIVGFLTPAGAYIAMDSTSLGAARVLAWPTAVVDVMGSEAAVAITRRRDIAELPEHSREAGIARFAAEHSQLAGGLDRAVQLGIVDDVIEPAQTRATLASLLATCTPTRSREKNIPL